MGAARGNRANRRAWEDWGRVDPLWAVVTAPDARDGGWDDAEFFATGERTVADLWARARARGLPASTGDALDFGCGVGRLSRALAARVDRVTGVDVSASMLEEARRRNRDVANLTFRLRGAGDPAALGPDAFDVVCCLLVLQHLPAASDIERHVAELVGVLRPGGAMFLQLTTRLPPDPPRRWRDHLRVRTRLAGGLRRLGVPPRLLARVSRWRPAMPMTAVPEDRAVAVITAAGGTVVWSQRSVIGPDHEDCTFLVTR